MPYFEKQEAGKTKWWELTREAEGHRFYVAWGVIGARGQGMTCTRDSPEDCDRMIASKIRQKVKSGYVEVPKQASEPKSPSNCVAGKKKSKVLIYEPRALGVFVRKTADGKPGTVLEVHDYRGAVARVTRGDALELALPTGETHALTPKEVLDRLEAFVRTG